MFSEKQNSLTKEGSTRGVATPISASGKMASIIVVLAVLLALGESDQSVLKTTITLDSYLAWHLLGSSTKI